MTTALHDLIATTPGLPCTTTDPELWFSKSSRERDIAASLCRECPIQQACLDYAISHPSYVGIWGGATHAGRRSVLRAVRAGERCRLDLRGRMRLVCGTERAYRSHFGHQEQPGADCVGGDCVAAHEVHITAERRARLAVEHAAGGSSKGFWIHRSLGEPACEECRTALLAQQAIARQGRARRGRTRARAASVAPGASEVLRGAPEGVQAFAIAS